MADYTDSESHGVTQAGENCEADKGGQGQRQGPPAADTQGKQEGSPAELQGKNVPERGLSKRRSLQEKRAGRGNEATHAGSLARSPGAQQMPALYFKAHRTNPTHVSFS